MRCFFCDCGSAIFLVGSSGEPVFVPKSDYLKRGTVIYRGDKHS